MCQWITITFASYLSDAPLYVRPSTQPKYTSISSTTTHHTVLSDLHPSALLPQSIQAKALSLTALATHYDTLAAAKAAVGSEYLNFTTTVTTPSGPAYSGPLLRTFADHFLWLGWSPVVAAEPGEAVWAVDPASFMTTRLVLSSADLEEGGLTGGLVGWKSCWHTCVVC